MSNSIFNARLKFLIYFYFYFVEWTMDILAEKICKPKDIITVT